MANAGFQVFNDNNFIQIDGEYKNMLLVGKGQFTPPTSGNERVVVPRPANYINSIIAVRCTRSHCVVLGDSSNWFLMIAPDLALPGGAIVEYWIFAVRPAGEPVAGGSGLLVYNEQGEVVYNSNDKAMRVVGRVTTPMVKDQDIQGSIPTARKVAIVQSVRPQQIESRVVVIGQQLQGRVGTWTGTIRSALSQNGWRIVNSPAGSYPGIPVDYTFTSTDTDYLLLDVDGY